MNLDIITDGRLIGSAELSSGRLRVASSEAPIEGAPDFNAFSPAPASDAENRAADAISSNTASAADPILFAEILLAENADPSDGTSDGTFSTLAAAPNDPFFGTQFGLTEIGALEANEILQPRAQAADSDPILVAVIDTGIDFNHPDLIANIFTNDLEANGTPGVDDDGNGVIDDISGFDFVDEDNDPTDENFHGTAVAGVIAAEANNGFGIAGVADAFNVEILPVRALGADGSGTLNDVAESIVFAVNSGADVINLSLGGGGFSQSLFNALAFAEANDVLVVAAAGNSGQDNDITPTFPASFGFDNILSVAATDSSGGLASFSNFGATSVDLGAPGVNITTTTPGGQFGSISGTSFSSPLVAGAAAALLASLPDDVTNPTDTVIDLLLDTTASATELQGTTATGGILDFAAAAQALVEEFPLETQLVVNDDEFVLAEDSVGLLNPLANDTGDGLEVVSFTAAEFGTVQANADGTFTFTPDANFAGNDSFTYTVIDSNGQTITGTVNLTVTPVNDGPTANDDTVQTQAGVPLTIAAADLLANDSDIEGDLLSLVAVDNAVGGSVAIDGTGNVVFLPAANFTGGASFEYTITDGNGGTSTATVAVEVLAPAPIAPSPSNAASTDVTGTDFEGGIDDNFWAEIGNAIVNTNFGGSGNSLFFTGGSRNDASRFATTRSLDISDGGVLEFDLVFGTSGNGGENADSGEDVSLSFSVDGGQTFVEFARFDTEDFDTFTPVSAAIPAAAQTSATQFRFQQVRHSGSNFDNFGLDNVNLVTNSSLGALVEPAAGLSEDFNSGIDESGLWADVGNATVNSNFGGDGDSLFFTGGARGDDSRFATTTGVDVSEGGTIAFDLIFGNGSNGGENVDLGEDLALDFSIDGGQTWQRLGLYDSEAFPSFTTVSVDLPDAASSESTQFRFQQVRHSGGSFDNVGLDNIVIEVA